MMTRYNELVIQTPEGVRFVYQLASPVIRFLALAVDLAIIFTTMNIVSGIFVWMQWISLDLATAFFILLYFVLSIGYFILTEMAWRGQTIGKKMLRLRVLDANGLKLQPSQLIVRNLLRFVDSLPILYFLGGVCALFNVHSKRLGDLAAGTVVVRMPVIQAPVLSEVGEKRYNSFRDHPRLEAQLRQRVPAEEAELALQSLQRRDEMDPVSRTKLYRRLAAYFGELVTFPVELTDSLSDEQYLRNCVDTIYRAAK